MSYNNWIDEKIYWLTAVLSVDSDLFKRNYDSISELYRYFNSGKTQDAQKAVDIISRNLNIVSPILHFDWSGEFDHDLNIKGQMSHGQLIISLDLTLNKYGLAATAVHELMHYFLMYRKNIFLPNKNENEKITDLAAIVLGLGKVMINGKVLSTEAQQQMHILGYLSLEEIGYAYKKINRLRNKRDSSYLTYDALRIINGTIRHGTPSTFVDSTGFSLKQITGLYTVFKDIALDFFYFLKKCIFCFFRKKCPFCRKKITKNSVSCKFCTRTLIEKL